MNWIGIITTLLTVVNILVCLLLVFVVLLQRPKNEGLGAAFGGDTASNIFGAQTSNVLANITRWLGALFLGLCFVIAILGSINPDRKSLSAAYIEKVKSEREAQEAQKKAEEEAKAEALKVQGKNADGTPIEQEKPAAATPVVTPAANTPNPNPPSATPPGAPAPSTPSKIPPAPSPAAAENSASPSTPPVPAPKAPENKPAEPAEPTKPADGAKLEGTPAPEPVKTADPKPVPTSPGTPSDAPKPQ